MIIKSGIGNDEDKLPKRGFPVSIKNKDGKGVYALYEEGFTFVGVALEDAYNYVDFGLKSNCISVCYTGNVNCVAAESLVAGDIVVPSVDGFKKSLDGNGVGVVIRGGNANSHIEVLLKTI